MAEGGYKQFCPVAMAAEVICTRWTLIVLREMAMGSTRFNELRRGVPRMSPALLSKRLKELEAAGLVARTPAKNSADLYEYHLTASGLELVPVVKAVGEWGHKWIETETSLRNAEPNLLMWDIRRNIDPAPMPKRRAIVQIIFNDLEAQRKNWWIIVEPDHETDLCSKDPGFEVDLYLSTTLRALTEAWMGFKTIPKLIDDKRLIFTGPKELETAFIASLKLSIFAKVERMVA
jgi:DNA-binding HxlR family transcriptional regulator